MCKLSDRRSHICTALLNNVTGHTQRGRSDSRAHAATSPAG